MNKQLLSTVVALVMAASAVGAELHTDVEYAVVAPSSASGSNDGESLKLDVSVPEGEGPFPIAILVHGGGWSSGDKSQVHVPPTKRLTDKFTWFSIDYRLAPAHHWPACIDDVRQAIRWVKAHAAEYKGDPQRIAVIGYSAGGHLAAFAAVTAKQDTKVQAAVILAGPTFLLADCERRGQVSPALQALFDRGPELDNAARGILRNASPVSNLYGDLPPFLLIHGTLDESVLYSQSENFQALLNELNFPCEIVTIPGAGHNIRAWKMFDPNYEQKMVDWLHKTLSSDQ